MVAVEFDEGGGGHSHIGSADRRVGYGRDFGRSRPTILSVVRDRDVRSERLRRAADTLTTENERNRGADRVSRGLERLLWDRRQGQRFAVDRERAEPDPRRGHAAECFARPRL